LHNAFNVSILPIARPSFCLWRNVYENKKDPIARFIMDVA
jgi:hypothetical protein